MELGVCYYPEHWPYGNWRKDFSRMQEIGIKWVRIGEFAWSVLEPTENNLNFKWLDEVFELCSEFKLKIVLGTPTATPPHWMIKKHPDMLALDFWGNPRKFGSRRHYCFSHSKYQYESKRITEILAKRYGKHPSLSAWQTDNEYGCHDTVISYSDAAKKGFQHWLRNKYPTIERLNQAWGNVFWSMNYDDFSEIELPNLTVTEANPAWQLDFSRYSSETVVVFNRVQTEAIKQHSDLPIIHNFMGTFTDFDHYQVAEDLEIASWDSYPLGFLSQQSNETNKAKYLEQGDPDFQALHHELYYRVGKGRFWIMEQQPGPVNWAPYNPIPTEGMVRLWTMEAFFHGAEVVSYFRWRQAPWAQEQMHAGLLRSDNSESRVINEVMQIRDELKIISNEITAKPIKSVDRIGVVFDYESFWAWKIQPLSTDFSTINYILSIFKAIRKQGLSVEIISPYQNDWSEYKLVFLPLLFSLNNNIKTAIENNLTKVIEDRTTLILGPRTGGKLPNFENQYDYPDADWLPIRVKEVASYPKSHQLECFDREIIKNQNKNQELNLSLGLGSFEIYFENIELTDSKAESLWQTAKGNDALIKYENHYYLTGCGDEKLLNNLIQKFIKEKVVNKIIDIQNSITSKNKFDGLRVVSHKQNQNLILLMNYGKENLDLNGIEDLKKFKLIIGKTNLHCGDIAIYKSE